ncbi:MAG: FAD/NAD(P)-binding protein [Methyloceanibacter sp.]
MAEGTGKHFIIVGGGASGVLLACHLLRNDDDEIRVTLVEKREAVGRGMAYSTAQPGHLLNVRASNMSAFADDPSHFQRWLATHNADSQGGEPGRLNFAQRRVYGRYIAELINPHLGAPGEPGRLQVIYGEGRSISIAPSGVRLSIDDGRCFAGDVGVLATGHDEAPRGGSSCYVNPWESPAASDINRDAAVLIRGTGLTMVDFVVSLRAADHRGPIYAMSRRGLLPQAHRAVTALNLNPADICFGASLVTLWRFVRRLAKETMAAGGDWRSVVDGIRPYTWELWRRLPFDSKQRFLRHARAYWEVHRHRMAPEIADEIKQALASGQLRIIVAKTNSIFPTAGGARIAYRRRGKTETENLNVAKVAECTGVYADPLVTTNPVLQQLFAQGIARPDPLGIGIDVDADCAIVDASGHASRVLYGVGPLTRAAFWEIMAVPDIRVQCAELANHLLSRAPGESAGAARVRLGGGTA